MSISKHAPELDPIYAPVQESLDQVREILSHLWNDVLCLVQPPAPGTPPQQAQGKLLRPAACLLGAGTLQPSALPQLIKLAASYEAMHLASLVHDDIVDQAALRRGQSSLHKYWNEHAAILGGDYLVARALQLMVDYENTQLIAGILSAVRDMSEGELLFLEKSWSAITEEDCLNLAKAKTASLFAASCAGSAVLLAPDHYKTLDNYGVNAGIAFQLTDDMLDLTQPFTTLGKQPCGDISEKKKTLPIFLLRNRMNAADLKTLKSLGGKALSEEECVWIKKQIDEHDVETTVDALVDRYIQQGIECLAALPPSSYRDSLEALAHYIPRRVT
ncbi:MAG: polyprenyl synthetase family protein [Candidatus Hydrogenedens sp.]|jgi:geranylgeranyl pyrophosphate synthase|nr:polyprenyl synthetase family protein [Candidatus Hydrogenedens sp.]